MTNMELETDIEALDMEMGDITIHYCPVIPNPEGEPTAELKTADIEGTIYEIVDEEARTELENKVDKVEGKDLSTNDYTDEDKAIVDGVTTALDGKVDKDGDKVLSDNNYSDTDKAIVDGVTEALNGKADKSDTYTKTEVDSALDNKVDKVGGKGLSANDFTDTLKDKLDGIEAEANKTVVDNSVTATSTNPVESKAIYNMLNDLLPEAEETGNPISITNASGLNAKSLKVELEPIQDLNGYDSPWVGGGGVNKYPESAISGERNGVTVTHNKGTYTLSGTATAYSQFISDDSFTLKAGTYNFKQFNGASGIYFQLRSIDGTTIYASSSSISTIQFTLENDTAVKARICVNNNVTTNLSTQLMITEGSTVPTSYVPYSNICPISGRTQTTVSVNSEDTTIQFGQTVYGGTCDVVNGGTSDEKKYLSFKISECQKTATYTNTERYYKMVFETDEVYKEGQANNNNSKCNMLTYGYNTSDNPHFFYAGQAVTFFVPKGTSTDTKMEFLATLITPTTISTPSNEISLLKGANTLVADGEMELVYSKIPQ